MHASKVKHMTLNSEIKRSWKRSTGNRKAWECPGSQLLTCLLIGVMLTPQWMRTNQQAWGCSSLPFRNRYPECRGVREWERIRVCWCCSVAQSYLTLCDPMGFNTPYLPVPHHLPKFAQVLVHCISDAIQPSYLLMLSSSALNLSQPQGLFQWVSCSPHITKILEFQLQYQSFQQLFRVDFP